MTANRPFRMSFAHQSGCSNDANRDVVRAKCRKETFERIDIEPLSIDGELPDPAALIREMRDERDAVYSDLIKTAERRKANQ